MKSPSKLFKIITDKQIVSALIWAATILACSADVNHEYIPSILITAAGFHFVLMSRNNSTCLSKVKD